MLESVLGGPLREAVLAIVDDGDTSTRRGRTAAAALGVAFRSLSRREALEAMIVDRSEVVRSIAAHYLAELGPDAEPEVRSIA